MSNELSFQPFSAEFAQDPYAVYKQLREQQPVFYFKDWDAYLLSCYEDIATLVNDSRLVRTLDHILPAKDVAEHKKMENWDSTPNLSAYVRFSILESEGETHDRLRKLVFRIFTPARVHSLRNLVQERVSECLDIIVDKKEADFVEEFFAQIPGHVIGMLLGIPKPDRARLRIWSENIVQVFEPERTAEHIQLAEDTTREFADYLLVLIEERRRQAEDDLLSELIHAESEGKLNRDELISTCILILAGGHGSTIDVSGNGLLALLRHPEQLRQLRQEPELIQTAVQEMLRYDPPLPYFHRFLAEDVEYKGVLYEKGTKFGILYASANRDPAQFPNADTFDIRREPNRHLAFGIGAHFCLGNHLARLNMDIMFSSVLKRMPELRLIDDNPEFRPGITSRGLKTLPVSW